MLIQHTNTLRSLIDDNGLHNLNVKKINITAKFYHKGLYYIKE